MRHLFFTRELEGLDLQVLADPADPQVLVLPLGPDPAALRPESVAAALEQVQLVDRVQAAPEQWRQLEGALAIPWAEVL